MARLLCRQKGGIGGEREVDARESGMQSQRLREVI